MPTSDPLVSILLTTYNRSSVLPRAIESVFAQDFDDFELIIIDDCSSDDTPDVVASYSDPRIRSIRNEQNVGGEHGDRAHVRRFVYELMKGRYFVYLCDDDYWLPKDLLSKQCQAFEAHDDVAMVMMGQLSHFITTPDSYLEWRPDETIFFSSEKLNTYFDFETMTPKTKHLYFHSHLFSKQFLTSDEYLTEFSLNPTQKNIMVGATLYSKEHFVRSRAISSKAGSQWQSGYEFRLGPGAAGNVVYYDEPAILTEIRTENASFQRTQVDHYLDSVKSIETAMETPLSDASFADRREFLRRIKNETIRNLSRTYLTNTISIKKQGTLSLCSDDNIKAPVTWQTVLPVYWRNKITPDKRDLLYFAAAALPHQAVDRAKELRNRWRN